MVSPGHTDNQKSENQQAPSPAVEQQVPVVVEKKRPWLKPPMRVVLGVVVPLIGGIAIACLFLVTFQNDASYSFGSLGGYFGAFLLGLIGAVLLRSWWAILVVPITLTLGVLLVVFVAPFLFFPNPLGVDDVAFGVFANVVITNIIALLTVFSTLVGFSLAKKKA